MKRVGIDVDGVLRDLMSGVNKVFMDYYPKHFIKGQEPYNYDYPHIKMPLKEKFHIIFNEHPEEIFLKTSPYPGTISQFNLLKKWAQKKNIKLVCATSQETHLIGMTYLWLGQYNLVFNELQISKDKGSLGLDYLVDDAPPNYENWIKNGNPEENFILMDRSWNKDVSATNRIKQLSEITKIII